MLDLLELPESEKKKDSLLKINQIVIIKKKQFLLLLLLFWSRKELLQIVIVVQGCQRILKIYQEQHLVLFLCVEFSRHLQLVNLSAAFDFQASPEVKRKLYY